MKNYLFFLFAICLLFSTQDAMADDYITDSYGVVYMISGDEAMVVNADRYNLHTEVEIKSYVSDKAGRHWYAVTTLKDDWLKDVKKTIERVTLPKTLKELPFRCFKDCKELKSVDFSGNPTKLNYIPAECFEGCSNLQSFTIPESVHTIGNECFSGCI